MESSNHENTTSGVTHSRSTFHPVVIGIVVGRLFAVWCLGRVKCRSQTHCSDIVRFVEASASALPFKSRGAGRCIDGQSPLRCAHRAGERLLDPGISTDTRLAYKSAPENSASMIGHSGTSPPAHCWIMSDSTASRRRKSSIFTRTLFRCSCVISWTSPQV